MWRAPLYVSSLTWQISSIPSSSVSREGVKEAGENWERRRNRSVVMSDRTGDFEPFTLISQESEGGNGEGLMGKISAGKDWIQGKHAGVRSWSEFFSIRKVSKPKGAGDVTKRLVYNVQRYQSNYLFVFLGLMAYCVITNPTLLFALAFCLAAWWFLSVKNRGENISLLGRETSPKEIYTVLGVVMVPVFYFVGAGNTVFWIIGASVVIILVHAILMSPSEQTADEELGIVMEDVTVS